MLFGANAPLKSRVVVRVEFDEWLEELTRKVRRLERDAAALVWLLDGFVLANQLVLALRLEMRQLNGTELPTPTTCEGTEQQPQSRQCLGIRIVQLAKLLNRPVLSPKAGDRSNLKVPQRAMRAGHSRAAPFTTQKSTKGLPRL